ncbi:alpha/beta-hydrolase [Fomitiporia mediterranea MF3/22]|uniref:alpha/beta-hydrolase n=1 Tax=Fomitiporia mediterranea (strain MF3/22) TaxID=694068 RepID=UPI000440749F|nr:alpha/beta-hydrolase [Fomitiporia mediterranea MF3/22]EJC98641.1 alpha/beta-hydrolase [Fomitiporia mediterranea MF3/22]
MLCVGSEASRPVLGLSVTLLASARSSGTRTPLRPTIILRRQPLSLDSHSNLHTYTDLLEPNILGLARKALAWALSGTVMSLASIVFSLLRHGPNIMLYPGAFETHPREVHLPSAWGLQYEDVTLTTSDKIKIRAYLLLQPDQETGSQKTSIDSPEYGHRPTVIMFHGNCDNIGYTLPLAQIFSKRMRCNVLMLSPRGYGHSEGRPSTKGFQRDADAALNFVLSHSKLSKAPIVLYGQSIGGAMAVDLAVRHADKIAALIIENTFTSLRRLIPEIMPIFTFVAPFFRQWNSARKLKRLPHRVALLMLSGQRDEIVPPKHMRELWEIATEVSSPSSKTKSVGESQKADKDDKPHRSGRLVEIPQGGHNDTWDDPAYWDAIESFLESLPTGSSAK